MKTYTGLAMILGAMLGAGYAAPARAGAQAGGNSVALANGTTLNAELSASIDSKKLKAGDALTAQITEAVKEDGRTVIPKGAKLVGHVTKASARAKGDSESALAIQFDKALLKNGQEIPLSAWIGAIAAAPRNVYQSGPEQNTMAGTPGAGPSPMGGSGHSATSGSATRTGSPVGAGRSADDAERTAGAGGGLNAAGQLTATSRGVFGLDSLHLTTDASTAGQGSLITSSGKNVRLDSGTRLLLVVRTDGSAAPNK